MPTKRDSTLVGAITARLKELSADRPHLMEIADELSNLDAAQVLGRNIWIRGIPAGDQIGITSIISAESLNAFVASLTKISSLRTIKIFPYGIPTVDFYQIATVFGNVAAEQEIAGLNG